MIHFHITVTLLMLTLQLSELTTEAKHGRHRTNRNDMEDEPSGVGRTAAEIVPRKISIYNGGKNPWDDLESKVPEVCRKLIHELKEKDQKDKDHTERKISSSDTKEKESSSSVKDSKDSSNTHKDAKEVIPNANSINQNQKTPAGGKDVNLKDAKDNKSVIKDSNLKVFNESEFKALKESMMREAKESITSEIREKEIQENALREAKAKRNENPITGSLSDSSTGKPANNVHGTLWKMINDSWIFISEKHTDPNGKISQMINGTSADFTPGMFKLSFDSKSYYKPSGIEPFYPYIEVIFEVKNIKDQYHVVLLIGPHGYTTYRSHLA